MFSEQFVELLEKRPDMALDEIRTHFGKQCFLNAVHKLLSLFAHFNGKTLYTKPEEEESPFACGKVLVFTVSGQELCFFSSDR